MIMPRSGLLVLLALILIFDLYIFWPRLIDLMLPPDSRPGKIRFPIEKINWEELSARAQELKASYPQEFKHIERFESRSEATLRLFEWIEVFYNRVRRHSTLGYLSPVDYENKNAYA